MYVSWFVYPVVSETILWAFCGIILFKFRQTVRRHCGWIFFLCDVRKRGLLPKKHESEVEFKHWQIHLSYTRFCIWNEIRLDFSQWRFLFLRGPITVVFEKCDLSNRYRMEGGRFWEKDSKNDAALSGRASPNLYLINFCRKCIYNYIYYYLIIDFLKERTFLTGYMDDPSKM